MNPPITRRSFIRRSGLLLTALGLSGSVQAGLLDGIARKAVKRWGREALAQQAGGAKYLVEICLRAGFQSNCLFPSTGHTTALPDRNPVLNFYSSPGNVVGLDRDGKTTWFARYVADQGADRLRQQIAAIPGMGIATSETVALQTGQHTPNFASRSPVNTASAPSIVHQAIAPGRPVQHIFWRNGAPVNNRIAEGMAGPNEVQSRSQFQTLFRSLPAFFTRDELRLIAGTFDEQGKVVAGQEGAIQRIDEIWRRAQDPRCGAYSDTDTVVVNSAGGRNQLGLSLEGPLNDTYAQIAPNFGATIDNPLGGLPVGQALCSAAAAFHRGAATTFTVALDSSDWHRDIPVLDAVNSKQGQWNLVLGNALAGLVQSAAQLADPDGQGTVADHLLVSITSEFTRTSLRLNNGSDNGDGGRASFTYIGKKVKNGSFGNVEGTTGNVVGFDRVSGANGGPTPTEAQLYRTTLKLIGADSMAVQSGVSALPLDAVIR